MGKATHWQPIETGPRHVRPGNMHFGPMVYVWMPYRPKGSWDIGWWDRYHNCWRFTGEDGPLDMQPTHWQPLDDPIGEDPENG